ncbi:MAG: flagellar filament capping protein FliD [Planctomycetales bacterium]|nr:flagellar filament capping protein FliD [Planctomycetales bacterium]
MLNIDGLVTGIDTKSVIDGMLEIQQRQIDQLNSRKQGVVEQKAAIGELEVRLSGLKNSIVQLSRAGNNAFNGRLATVSDEEAAAVAVSNSAVPGSYRFTINTLAKAHQVASNSFETDDAEIETGTYSIRVGSGEVFEVKVDDANNTVTGLVEAINNANGDAAAALINDGSAVPYRVLLTSKETGAANELSVTFTPDGGSSADAVEFDFDNPVEAATDAEIKLGSGLGAIAVTNDTNQMDDVIPGVTLDLFRADNSKEISIDIIPDVEKAKENVTAFVESYNEFVTFVDEQSKFDPATNTASVLLGNRSVAAIRDEITRVVTSLVPGIGSEANRLSSIGITIDDKGLLQVDSTKLNEFTKSGTDSLTRLSRLLGATGTTTNPGVRFLLAGAEAKASPLDQDGKITPYKLQILSAATRARFLGTNAVQATTIDQSNNELVVSIDASPEVTLTLEAGTYTAQELVEHVEALINNHDDLRGRTVAANLEGGLLEMTSETYGKSSTIDFVSGTAMTALGLTGDEDEQTGQDVVGKFIFNEGTEDEYTEKATGSGQILAGTEVGGATEGLQLRVTLTESQVSEGDRIDVEFTRGIASKVSTAISDILASDTGRISQINEAFDDRIESIDKSIERLNSAFDSRREALVRQFAQLESTVGDLQGIGSLLTAQLTSFRSL